MCDLNADPLTSSEVNRTNHTIVRNISDEVVIRWKTRDNPGGQWSTIVSEDAIVLHYAYAYLSDVRDKASKSCPGAEYLAAAKRGDRRKVSVSHFVGGLADNVRMCSMERILADVFNCAIALTFSIR